MINLEDSYSSIPAHPKFIQGELVIHRKYGYRGVVVDIDSHCKASDQWYQANQTQPSKDQPWYHVLVHQASHVTYAAQENLVPDKSAEPIQHPMINLFFSGFENGYHLRNEVPWKPGQPPDITPPPPPSL